MAYKLKIGPAQGLKLKGQAGFALPMIGGIGIAAAKSGGVWYVDLDYSKVQETAAISDSLEPTSYVLTWESTANSWSRISTANIKADIEATFDGYYQPLDATLTALAALDSTAGLLVQTGADTFARRTLTGTANEITVTNGDGVAGHPTVSLPAALTFTGKTVTGGTYTGVVSINGNFWTAGTGTLTLGAGKTATISNTLTFTGTDGSTAAFGAGGTVAYQGGTLAQFAATTSAQLRGVLSDETGTGAAYFQGGDLGTPSAGVATNLTGTASGLTAGNVTTNANMTGDVTSVGNATTIGATKVTSAMLNANVFSSPHTWSGVQTFSTAPVVPTQSPSDNSTKAASTAYVDAQVAGSVAGVASIGGETGALIVPFGQAKLAKSGSNIVLSPYGGNILTINGANKRIPTSGVSLAPTGLTVGTVYYIYAYMSSGTMTLEASTTGHSTSTTAGNEGVEIKTGDDTRSLVGMVRIDTGTVFSDTATARYVRSWFNDGGVESVNYFTANRSITSTAAVEINSEIRLAAILWAGERWVADAQSPARNSAASGANSLGIDFDGAGAFSGGVSFAAITTANDTTTLSPKNILTGGSEGLHTATLVGAVSSGTGLYFGDMSSRKTSLRAFTRR